MIQPPTKALVRHIPKSYLLYNQLSQAIDLDKARHQHAQYVQALRRAGLSIAYVDADEHFPDCVFIEDPCVVWGNRALLTRLGPDENHKRFKIVRDGEQHGVEPHLMQTHQITRLEAPGTLEGGDVLHTYDTTYVGLSSRTNQQGIKQLEQFMAPFKRKVVTVPVTKCLHLKSAATYLGDGVLLANSTMLNLSSFKVNSVIEIDPSEKNAANCLRIGHFLFMPAGYPNTERKLRNFAQERGLELACLEISEFEKAEGSITCLSVIW